MERFSEFEMGIVSRANQASETHPDKFKAFHIILENNFNEIPENYTAVFLRGTPVQVVPDYCIREIRFLSLRGFFHEINERRFVCKYNAGSEEGIQLYRAIMDCVVRWMDQNLS
jgi:hypothetical protein